MSENNKKDWLKITQFILSLCAFLFTIITAAGFFAGGSIFSAFLDLTDHDIAFLLSIASVCLLLSLFHINSAIQALKKPSAPHSREIRASRSFLFACIALLTGDYFF